ncbi:putative serine protease K12H4.7 isoform X1 [Danaus plexippus]|uniref:putative serine protease K12H4.7 isoform X1 n=1 Tax=Danaus plexippus TaxID=13037 RepID=UPI002AB28842|nr:putative serine protease K12H4.7 isoform X1 [Danaus plexippus]
MTRKIKLLCILLTVSKLAWGESDILEPPLRVDLKPPVEYNGFERRVKTAWIDMPIDHFDPQNRETYQMRYMYNEEFFGGNDYPIFIMVGGEWNIQPGWLLAGNMYLMAQENRGYLFYTEHRYYGESLPYTTFTTENLRFLNVDQALADLAYFISEIKKIPSFVNSKVVLYGGSYAGNMVLWLKQRYPHLVVGVVASSGPIKAQVDFPGYLEVVHNAFLSEGGQECVDTIKQGIADTIAAMETEDGRRSIQRIYRLCVPLDYSSRLSMGYFSGYITWTFSTSVQTARPGSLTAICQNFTNNVYGSTPMEQIGGYIADTRSISNCLNVTYDNYVASYNKTVPSNGRAWYYQTCTEYGYYHTAPKSGTAFDQLTWLDVPFYVDLCKRVFNEKFTESFVMNAIDRVNLMFGGLYPNVNNTINIHGDIDPWHVLGVYDRDLKETSPTILVPRASHCFDMSSWRSTDTIKMTAAQQRARSIVAEWLS